METTEHMQRVTQAIALLAEQKIANDNREYILSRLHILNSAWREVRAYYANDILSSIELLAKKSGHTVSPELKLLVDTMQKACRESNIAPVNAPNSADLAVLICQLLDNKLIEYDRHTLKFYILGESPVYVEPLTPIQKIKSIIKQVISKLMFWRKK